MEAGGRDQACWHSHRWWQKCQCKCDCSLCAIFPKRVITTGCLTRWKLPQARGTNTTLNCSMPRLSQTQTHIHIDRLVFPLLDQLKKKEWGRYTHYKSNNLKWKYRAMNSGFHVEHFFCVTIDFSPPVFVLLFSFLFFLNWRQKARLSSNSNTCGSSAKLLRLWCKD